MSPHNTSIDLKELSYLTGFSISTVSKALNDKLDISVKTKRLITQVAREHNYIPNSFAVGLRNKKSRTIAIILPQVNVDFYSDLLFYFQQIADRFRYRIIVFQSFESEINETRYLSSICDGSVDGAIVISSTKNNFYSKDFTIPVSTILITEALSQEAIIEFCLDRFESLLTKIP